MTQIGKKTLRSRSMLSMLSMLTLVLLLFGMTFAFPAAVNADDGEGSITVDGGKIILEESVSTGLSQAVTPGYHVPGSNTIFEQPLRSREEHHLIGWNSDAASELLSSDDFWGLTKTISGIYWYGINLVIIDSENFVAGDPSGLEFEIKFYQDDGGSPGTEVVSFSGITPSIEVLYIFDPAFLNIPVYRFDVPGLAVPEMMGRGWVSIQCTATSDESVFFWLDSTSGNENALQYEYVDGKYSQEDEEEPGNLAYGLTASSSLAVGGEIRPVNGAGIAALIAGLGFVLVLVVCKIMKIAGRHRINP
ncbi:MAG: hypothetical protein JXA46_06655 [Dehalococcoidales bacterium]|nr:hypothetical protein [Dehalococcoidales bacterium]